jgi:hypothetical protein
MSEDFFMLLLKAWKVSDSVSDDDFRKAIIAEYFRSTTKLEDKALPLAYIEYAYEEVNVFSMRVFIIEEPLATHDMVGVASGINGHIDTTRTLQISYAEPLGFSKTASRSTESPSSASKSAVSAPKHWKLQ